MSDPGLTKLRKELVETTKDRGPNRIIFNSCLAVFLSNVVLLIVAIPLGSKIVMNAIWISIGSLIYLIFSALAYVLIKYYRGVRPDLTISGWLIKMIDTIMIFYLSLFFLEMGILEDTELKLLVFPFIDGKTIILSIYGITGIGMIIIAHQVIQQRLKRIKNPTKLSMPNAIRISGLIGGVGIIISEVFSRTGQSQLLLTFASYLSILFAYFLLGIGVVYSYELGLLAKRGYIFLVRQSPGR